MTKFLVACALLVALIGTPAFAKENRAVTCEGNVGVAHTLTVGHCSFTGLPVKQVLSKCKEDEACRVQAFGWDNHHDMFIIERIISVEKITSMAGQPEDNGISCDEHDPCRLMTVPKLFQGTWLDSRDGFPLQITTTTFLGIDLLSIEPGNEDGNVIVVTWHPPGAVQGVIVKEVLEVTKVNGRETLITVNKEDATSITVYQRPTHINKTDGLPCQPGIPAPGSHGRLRPDDCQ